MLNYIWGMMIIISIISSFFTEKTEELSSSILNGASESIYITISLLGTMCLFTGLLKIADKGGITRIVTKLLAPILAKLFPDYPKDSKAFKSICMNITANLLGLGNAATPLGIKAMQEMATQNRLHGSPNNSMVRFVVFNTASIQIIPTMMSALRQKHNSSSPFDVLPAIWITSLFSLLIGIIATKIFEKKE